MRLIPLQLFQAQSNIQLHIRAYEILSPHFFSTQGSLSRSVDSSGVSDIFSGACEFFLKISHLGGFHIYNIL